MLSLKPEKIAREIAESEKHLKLYLNAVRQVRGYMPNAAYCNGDGTAEHIQHDNYVFDLVATQLPRLVYDNPRFTCRGLASPSGVLSPEGYPTSPAVDLAESLEAGVNQWCGIIGLRKILQELAVDYLLGWFVAMVKTEPMYPGQRDDGSGQWSRRLPRVVNLGPDEFRIDPYAKSYETASWKGHVCVAEKEELLAEAEDEASGWIMQALTELPANSEAKKLGREPGFEQSSEREEVHYYEIWVSGYRLPDAPGPDEGYHGTICTITIDGATLREPRPYYGPRWGPYAFCGAYPVPRRIYPVSPAVAHKPIVDDLNQAIEVVQVANKGYKRLVLYDAANPALGDALKTSEHDFMVPVVGFMKDQVVPIEIGGATEHQLAAVMDLRNRLDRTTGMQEAARGGLTQGSSTATEVGVADSAYQMRSSFITQSFADGVLQIAKTAGWHMHMDDRVVFGLDPENVPEEGADAVFYGGLHEGQTPEDFDDLIWDLEPLSMERTAQGMQQRRMQAAVDTVVTIAPMIAQFPNIDWRRLLELVGDAHQLRRFDELILTDQLMGGQPGAVPGTGMPTDPAMAAAVDPAAAPIPEEEPTLGELLAAAESQGQETGAATAADMGAGV